MLLVFNTVPTSSLSSQLVYVILVFPSMQERYFLLVFVADSFFLTLIIVSETKIGRIQDVNVRCPRPETNTTANGYDERSGYG